MNWTSGVISTAWNCEFTFEGPLKRKGEGEKCNYVMIWIGDKGRDVYVTG